MRKRTLGPREVLCWHSWIATKGVHVLVLPEVTRVLCLIKVTCEMVTFHRGSVQLWREFCLFSEFSKEGSLSYFAHSRHPDLNSTFRKFWCCSVSACKMAGSDKVINRIWGEGWALVAYIQLESTLLLSRHDKTSFTSPTMSVRRLWPVGLAHYGLFWVCRGEVLPHSASLYWDGALICSTNIPESYFLLRGIHRHLWTTLSF